MVGGETVGGSWDFLPEMIKGGTVGGGAVLGVDTTGRLGGALGVSNSLGKGGMSIAQGADVTEKFVN